MIGFAFLIILAEIIATFGVPKSNVKKEKNSYDLPEIQYGDPCDPGKTYKMDCNTCHCTDNGKLLCSNMACYEPNDFNPKLLRNNKKLSSSVLPKAPKGPCVPGIVYKNECHACICDDKKEIHCGTGKHDLKKRVLHPKDLYEPLSADELEALETLESFSSECKPGKAYKVDCNLCLCNELRSLMCDQYACLNVDPYTANKIAAYQNIGKPCKEDQKLEFNNTCVTCTCINGKTECQWEKNCEDHNYMQELEGTLELQKIDPEVDSCVPGGLYTILCNRCNCMYDAAFRCTQMYCLDFSKANELRQEH